MLPCGLPLKAVANRGRRQGNQSLTSHVGGSLLLASYNASNTNEQLRPSDMGGRATGFQIVNRQIENRAVRVRPRGLGEREEASMAGFLPVLNVLVNTKSRGGWACWRFNNHAIALFSAC
jgi:hypothetical protein